MLCVLGDRRVTLCRELTKIHEEIFRGSISEAIDHFQNPRGEFTIIISSGISDISYNDNDLLTLLNKYRTLGVETSKAVKQVAKETGINRSEVYKLWVRNKIKS